MSNMSELRELIKPFVWGEDMVAEYNAEKITQLVQKEIEAAELRLADQFVKDLQGWDYQAYLRDGYQIDEVVGSCAIKTRHYLLKKATIPSNQKELISFITDPKNIAKAAEGSMDKRASRINENEKDNI